MDVGDLLELQRSLERHGVVDAAPEVEDVGRFAVLLGDAFDQPLAPERFLHEGGQRHEVGDEAPSLVGRHAPPLASELERQQVERGQLRRERLGARDADLGARVRVEHVRRAARDRGVDDVADREHRRAALARGLDGGQRVRRLPRLRHDDQQRLRVEERVAVAELAAVVDLARQAREPLDEELADEAGVPRRAAGHEHGAPDALRPAGRQVAVELDVARLLEDPTPHRVDDRLRLLVDLLQEEVLEAALLRGDRVPRDDARRARHGLAVEGGDDDAPGRQLRNLAVLQEEHAARVLEERRDVGRHEVLAVAEADDDWRRALRGDHPVRLGLGQHDDRVRALERLHGAAGRVGKAEARLHLLIDQVRDHLCVGLREHPSAAALERGAQLEIVLDDAVVDEDHLACPVRMGVLLRRTSMRRPPRVADAGRARERLLAERAGEVVELSDAAADLDVVVGECRQACRVVAAVLELTKTRDQDRARLARAHVTDDAAHRFSSFAASGASQPAGSAHAS